MKNQLKLISELKKRFFEWKYDIESRFHIGGSTEFIIYWWMSKIVLNYIKSNPIECKDKGYTSITLDICRDKKLYSTMFPADYFKKCPESEAMELLHQVQDPDYQVDRMMIFNMMYCTGTGVQI